MRKPNINYMMRYVKEYLDGKKERWEFDLDFDYELMNHWDAMCREEEEYALVFNEWIAESGVDAGRDLGDSEFKELLQQQYDEVKSIAATGFY
jgi:hypothetical protein